MKFFLSGKVATFKSGRKQLGQGRTSDVLLALHGGELVAVKVANEQHLESNFILELTTVLKLPKSPYLMQPIGFSSQAIVFELSVPGSLHDVLLQQPNLSWINCLQILLDISLGLNDLHKNGWVHRDIKPDNILIDISDESKSEIDSAETFYRAKISDFGATIQLSNQEELRKLKGSPIYVAPEVKSGNASTKSDIYSFGLLILTMIIGQKKFSNFLIQSSNLKGQDLINFLTTAEKNKLIEQCLLTLEKLTQANEQLSASDKSMLLSLYQMVRSCTILDPTKRPNIEEVVQQIQYILQQNFPEHSPPPSPKNKAKKSDEVEAIYGFFDPMIKTGNKEYYVPAFWENIFYKPKILTPDEELQFKQAIKTLAPSN